MLKHFFTTSIRSLFKQKGYLFINVLGLAVGLTCFMLIALYVLNELSYDRFNTKVDRIYRVKIKGQMSGQELNQAITAAPMAKALITDYPEVESVTRFAKFGAWLIQYNEKSFNEDHVVFADSSFFDVFDYLLLRGNPHTALDKPRSMILTEETAKRYFGDEDPIGKSLKVEEDTVHYLVTGVMQNPPENAHFHFDMLGSLNSLRNSMNNNWVSHNYYTYIVVKDGVSINQLEEKLQDMVVKYVGPQLKQILGISLDDFKNAGNFFGYYLQPLKDIHLRSDLQEEFEPNGNMSYVYMFSIIAVLILIIAIINFVNLATAKSSTRAKEVGLKKVVGATRQRLILQFTGESLMLSVFATLIALLATKIVLPNFNNLIGLTLTTDFLVSLPGISFLVLLTVFVGIMAGLYPAFVLAAFKSGDALKGKVRSGVRTSWLRSVFVVVQFTISIAIIIGAIVVFKQLDFMQNKDLGFDKEQLLIVRRPDALNNHLESFKNDLLQNSNIKAVANSRAIPGKEYSNNGMMKADDPQKNTFLLMQNRVSFDYPSTLGLDLVEGRFFSKDFGTDSTAIIINEAAVKLFGFDEPLGKRILQPGGQDFISRPIIGVVKDYHIESLHKKIEPSCLTVMYGNQEGYMSIRLNVSDLKETLGFIEQTWASYTSKQPFQYFFFDEDYNTLYTAEMKTGKIFTLFAMLAIFIACLGLVGLIAFTAAVRTKEIGVRKVLGASVSGIVALLSREILKLIVISTIIAWPIAWWLSKRWLEGFENQVDIGPQVYILSTGIALAVGWLAVSLQAVKAAYTNPADALRSE
nr:ABC transporter permease [Bacteroidota bacterium]